MKKILFVAAAALALFASCQKTEVVYNEGPQEISFVAVNKVATKTPVDGTTFRRGDNMQVAAYIVEGAADGWGHDFFSKTLFAKEGSASYWTGQPARYWPLTTSKINFLAVTQVAGGIDGKTDVTFDSPYASKAVIDFKENNCHNQCDLMFAAGQGIHEQGAKYDQVSMVFKHALAWINFRVSTSTPAPTGTEGCTITVNSITLNNAVYGGKLTLTNDQYEDTTPQTTADVVADWDITSQTKYKLTVPNEAGSDAADPVILNSTPTLFGNGLLVVPDGYAESFTINYTLKQSDGKENTFDYTYNLPNSGSWQMAMKYFYNISISLTEIEIDPSVTDWDETGITTPLDGVGAEETI